MADRPTSRPRNVRTDSLDNLNPKNGQRFRAGKGSLYEGGLKIPFLARWPGKIKAGRVTRHLCYFPDIMPTLAELSGATCPNTDGLSLVPSLAGKGVQKIHSHLYWEYRTDRRPHGSWRLTSPEKVWELFDLKKTLRKKSTLPRRNPMSCNV